MSASGLPTHPDLSAIIALLNHLLGQIETGDWDIVAAMQPEISQKLGDLQQFYESPSAIRNADASDRAKLAEIVSLINKAEVSCATRREQIAPLVNSLKALPDSIQA